MADVSSNNSSLLLVTAASSSLVAVLSPTTSDATSSVSNNNVRILLYQRSTGLLQTSLTAKLLSSSSPAAAGSSSAGTTTDDELHKNGSIQKLFLIDSEYCVLILNKEWIVFDLTRGVVAYHHRTGASSEGGSASSKKKRKHNDADIEESNNRLLDACVHQRHVYLLLSTHNKLRVYEHAIETGKLVRKIKAPSSSSSHHDGSAEITASMKVNDAYIAIRVNDGDTIRLLSRETGSKVKKLSLKQHRDQQDGEGETTGVGTCCPLAISNDSTTSSFVSTMLSSSNGQVAVLDWDNPNFSCITTMNSNSNTTNRLEFLVSSDKTGEWTLLVGGCFLLYGNFDELVRKTKIDVSRSDNIDRWSVINNNDELIAVLYKNHQYQIQNVPIGIGSDDKKDETITISWIGDDDDKTEGSKGSSKKRSRDATILGPAQAGASNKGVTELEQEVATKRSRSGGEGEEEDKDVEMSKEDGDDDENAPTIAERLAQMRQALEKEDCSDDDGDDVDKEGEVNKEQDKEFVASFQPRQASAESLTQLLHQSLQAGDDTMLELALQVRDANVVRSSCMQLDTSDIEILFTALTTRLAQKPLRGDALITWIISILQTQRMTSIPHLQALQNLLQERVQVFPDLLKLQGRLGILSSSAAPGTGAAANEV